MSIDPLGLLLGLISFAMVAGIRLEWREYQRSRVPVRSIKEINR
jgi:hypothetical protein